MEKNRMEALATTAVLTISRADEDSLLAASMLSPLIADACRPVRPIPSLEITRKG